MIIKNLKKIIAFLLVLSFGVAALPAVASAEVTEDDIDTLLSGASFTYTLKNNDAGSAEGVITFDFGEMPSESIASLKYYWVDSYGEKLAGYKHIIEFSDSYTSAYAKSNNVNALSAADVGYSFLNGAVIPFGACGISAELTITVGDSTVTKTVSNGNYVTAVGGALTDNSSLPEYKYAVTDYTADIGGEELYQLMYFADFHNYYEWKGDTEETVYDFKNVSEVYTYISSDGKKGSPQGKAMYAVNSILEADPKSIGTIAVGDLVNDSSDGSASSTAGYIKRGDYNTVLATYYQAGLMDYFNFLAVGNHDLIAHYADSVGNQFTNMLGLALEENKTLAENNTLVTGLPDKADSYYYDYYIGGDHYIVLSAPHESPSAFGSEQLSWLEALLAADDSAGVRTFIACHEPLTGTGVYTSSAYLADETELKAILNANSANHKVYFFTGHTHVSYLDNIQNAYISQIGNVSYIGLPYIWDTAAKDISQGLQVKVYEDKVVLIGRQLYENGAYCTDMLPSAMLVAYEDDYTAEIPSLIEISTAYELSNIGIDPAKPLSGNYILTADIDLSAYDSWTPIGYSAGTNAANNAANAVFTGTFDGNGHTISNMNCSLEGSQYIHAGLFGVLKEATVKNLCLKNCTSEAYGSGKTVTAGILAGATVSTTSPAPYSTVISNVAVIGGISTATINSTNPCSAGGLVGYSESGVTLRNCYVDADITGCMGKNLTAQSAQIGAGGLVGHSYKGKVSAENCVVLGSVNYSKGVFEGEVASLYIHTGSVLGFNSRAMSDDSLGSELAEAVNCYYIDTLGVNTDSIRSKNGISVTAEELSLCDISDISLSDALWLHNGFTPILKCSGEAEYTVGDVNSDGSVDILDLIRFKKHMAGNAVNAALKAADINCSKAIETDDMVSLRKLLLDK